MQFFASSYCLQNLISLYSSWKSINNQSSIALVTWHEDQWLPQLIGRIKPFGVLVILTKYLPMGTIIHLLENEEKLSERLLQNGIHWFRFPFHLITFHKEMHKHTCHLRGCMTSNDNYMYICEMFTCWGS